MRGQLHLLFVGLLCLKRFHICPHPLSCTSYSDVQALIFLMPVMFHLFLEFLRYERMTLNKLKLISLKWTMIHWENYSM